MFLLAEISNAAASGIGVGCGTAAGFAAHRLIPESKHKHGSVILTAAVVAILVNWASKHLP